MSTERPSHLRVAEAVPRPADVPWPEGAERRQATVVAAEIVPVGDASEPEDVAAVVARCLSTLDGVVSAYGGTVERCAGHGLVAFSHHPPTASAKGEASRGVLGARSSTYRSGMPASRAPAGAPTRLTFALSRRRVVRTAG